jgi:hypothetical protein
MKWSDDSDKSTMEAGRKCLSGILAPGKDQSTIYMVTYLHSKGQLFAEVSSDEMDRINNIDNDATMYRSIWTAEFIF